MNQIAPAFGPTGGRASMHTPGPSQAALLQEQRELERAMQLSAEESQRRNTMRAMPIPTPSAPPMSFHHSFGSPQPTLAPDGVEIVQPIYSISPSQMAPIPRPPRSSATAATAGDAGDELHAGSGECVICFDGPQSAVCVPCGHNAICMDCAGELLDTTRLCPVCRSTVREVIKLYRV